jgi:D-tyrosyl-tRNA(Tyr) deacylase
MRVVVQRSGPAHCEVNGKVTGSINSGLVIFVSVDPEDTEKDIKWMGNKISGLRIFPDPDNKMNRSILDLIGDPASGNSVAPSILSISQFTLHGRVKKGFRPSFTEAAHPDKGNDCYIRLNNDLRSRGIEVAEGLFGAMMDIHLVNDGPVTILIDSKGSF